MIEPPTTDMDANVLIAALRDQVADLTKKLEAALYRIDQMSRRIFGRSSERYDDPGQELMDLGALTKAAPAQAVTVIPAHTEAIVPAKTERSGKPKRKPIPEGLEVVEDRRPALPESSLRQDDGTVLVKIGENREERLHYVAPKFQKLVIITDIYGFPGATEAVLEAPKPAQIIPDGLPTTATLVQVAFQKYGIHLPLYRQQQEFARLGVDIARSTMCGWLSGLSETLMSLVNAVRDQVLAAPLIHSDDIPVDLLEPGLGKTKQARFWSYLGDGQVFFDFTESREGRWPQQILANYRGHMMADALAQYDAPVAMGLITRLGCWAHVRRKIYEARTTDPRAHELLVLIRKLYDVEREALDSGLTGDRRTSHRKYLRDRDCPAIIAAIKDRLDRWRPGIGPESSLPDSPFGKAVMYALNQWTELTRYDKTGDLPIDNNPAENIQRAIAVGRKNYLFIGSEGGGGMAAVFYTLIQSCRLQKLDPAWYLTHACERLLGGDTHVATFTPAAVALARRATTPSG